MSAGDVAALLARARAGEDRALGRLISIAERGGSGAEAVAAATGAASREAEVIGVTGAPGAGKSTLVGGLLTRLVAAGRRPAVVAVDPSSTLTGGAILGDRVRMDAVAAGAFVRSLATRGHQGGLSLAVPGAVRVLAACGRDPVIVETTGVGQAEVDIVATCDTTVLVLAPGWGDGLQANKAGLLEIADVLVVNKADRPGADEAVRDLELMLDLGHVTGFEERVGARPRVVRSVATTGEGADVVVEAIGEHRARLVARGLLAGRRAARIRAEVRDRVAAHLAARIERALDGPGAREDLESAAAGRISPAEVAARITASLTGGDGAE